MTKGFSLIEILIAILVMTIGIVGIYAIVPRSVFWGEVNVDKFIASKLAQEGLELVRNIRDTNWIKKETWNTNLAVGDDYEIDYNDPELSLKDQFLKINNDGFYQYENGKETKFKRKISIKECGDSCLKIISKVSWANNNFSLEENLYDWKGQ